jgi:hypothetical protein
MKLLDWLTSTRRPPPGTKVRTREEVMQAILDLNRPTAPYQIISGESEGVDLVAEWKIVDAQWHEIFAKADLKKVFRILMKLDDEKKEVRAVDREYSVEWRAGIPHLSLAAQAFRGQKQSIEFGTAYAFTEEFEPGQVYNYRFSTSEIKKPIQEAVTTSGWTYRGVTFGKL